MSAVANAVDLPVSVKMRRGLENGARTCLELGPTLVDAGAAAHATPALGTADVHGRGRSHTDRRARRRVDVPVIASGDITSRARAQTVLATTGGRCDGRASRPGNPLGAERDRRRRRSEADPRGGRRRADPLHPRDRSRAWRKAGLQLPEEVLRLVSRPGRFPRPFKQELVQLQTTEDVELRLLAAAPGGSASSGSRTSCRRETRFSSTPHLDLRRRWHGGP